MRTLKQCNYQMDSVLDYLKKVKPWREQMILIKTLVENTAISKEFKSKHGISFYIEN